MKIKTIAITALLVLLILTGIGYEKGVAADESKKSVQIGIIDAGYIMDNNDKATAWKEKMQQKQQNIVAEMEKLSREIDAISDNLQTRKAGSGDYLKLVREGMEKTAVLKAKEEYYQQELSAEKQKQADLMYQDILVATEKVAKQQGLDLVIRKSEYPMPSMVLYSSRHLNITEDVLKIINE